MNKYDKSISKVDHGPQIKKHGCLGPHLNMKARERLYEAFTFFSRLF